MMRLNTEYYGAHSATPRRTEARLPICPVVDNLAKNFLLALTVPFEIQTETKVQQGLLGPHLLAVLKRVFNATAGSSPKRSRGKVRHGTS